MRKVIAGLFYSVDGVAESPDKWVDTFDEVMEEEMSAAIGQQDDVLLGRVTYQEWAGYWPTATDEPFATFINTVHKHVASKTLRTAEWNNTRILSEVPGEVRKLKSSAGRDIGVHGSITLVRSLMREGLLDELLLTVFPAVAGTGRRLFETGDEHRRLQLVSSRATPSGAAILRYVVGTPPGDAHAGKVDRTRR